MLLCTDTTIQTDFRDLSLVLERYRSRFTLFYARDCGLFPAWTGG